MNNEDILVSIVMPAYNSGLYIRDTINSVLSQTYKNWELIIIDDCSQDNTNAIISDFSKQDSRIIFFKNKKNEGVAYSRNKGIEVASGAYIAFLDSDDLWMNNKLELQLKYMIEKNSVFSFSKYKILNNNIEKNVKCPFSKVRYKELVKCNYIGCLTVMIKSSVLKKYKMMKIGHEDYAMWLLILKEEKVFADYIDETLAIYRKHSNSISSNKIKTIFWVWNIYKNVLSYNIIISTFFLIRFVLCTLIKYKGD